MNSALWGIGRLLVPILQGLGYSALAMAAVDTAHL